MECCTSHSSMTISSGTLQNSDSLRRCSSAMAISVRQTSMSGKMPMLCRMLTDCWLGFVFISPTDLMYGTNVR